MMELLVVVLSIRLCIGGDTVCVNSIGVDNAACLDGGLSHPCKALGYVLTNMY